jgi:hypothetical protein
LVFLEPEQPALYYENINQLLKVFIQHPFIFNSLESLELLCNLLKQRVLELGLNKTLYYFKKTKFFFIFAAPILLRTIESCAPLIISSKRIGMLTYVKREKSDLEISGSQ